MADTTPTSHVPNPAEGPLVADGVTVVADGVTVAITVDRPEGRPADVVWTETTVNDDTGKKAVRVYKAAMTTIESYRSAMEHKMEIPEEFAYVTFYAGSFEFGKKAFRVKIDELVGFI
jgi:hypothetical protein